MIPLNFLPLPIKAKHSNARGPFATAWPHHGIALHPALNVVAEGFRGTPTQAACAHVLSRRGDLGGKVPCASAEVTRGVHVYSRCTSVRYFRTPTFNREA